MKKIRQRVMYLLEAYPHTRDSDLDLLRIHVYLSCFTNEEADIILNWIKRNYDFINNYKRQRAYIQNKEWLYPPNEFVKAKRNRLEKQNREKYGRIQVTEVWKEVSEYFLDVNIEKPKTIVQKIIWFFK